MQEQAVCFVGYSSYSLFQKYLEPQWQCAVSNDHFRADGSWDIQLPPYPSGTCNKGAANNKSSPQCVNLCGHQENAHDRENVYCRPLMLVAASVRTYPCQSPVCIFSSGVNWTAAPG